jgi:MFS family permease
VLFRQAPEEQRGRVVAAAMTGYGVGSSTGILIGGLLLDFLSASTTALVLAGAMAVFVVWGLMSPLRTARWPEEQAAEETVTAG